MLKSLAITTACLFSLFFTMPHNALGAEASRVGPPPPASGAGWVEMPAGAKSAYMGIHGGTVPVSLLASRDGLSMVTFVGRTGNDFLTMLHKNNLRPVEALTPMGKNGAVNVPANNATAILTAHSPAGNIPVFYCTGKGFARMDLANDQWLPFGLSEKPLLLEGQAGKPNSVDKNTKKYRRFLLQQRLQRPVLSSR